MRGDSSRRNRRPHSRAYLVAAEIRAERNRSVLKGESSKWIHEGFPKMQKFGWQDRYSAFSVSKSIVPRVVEYIKNQRQKHQGTTFEEEYLELLELHEVDIVDEKYLFD